MAVKLNGEQEKTIREVWGELDALDATPMERVSALETIGVEANYGNPNFGDRDSLGAFQQRASWGSAQDRLDPRKATRKYIETARQMRQGKNFTRAGDLAAAVQRPAAQYEGRYHQRRGEVLGIIKQLGLGDGSAPGGGGAGGGTGLAADVNAETPEAMQFDSTRGQVSQLSFERPPAPTATAPAPPAVVAGPAMPEAYGGQLPTPMAGAPAPKPELQLEPPPDYSQSFGTPQPMQAQAAAGSGSSTSNEAASAVGGAKPRVKIAAGANLAGKPIVQPLLNLLDEISSQADMPIVVGTGTNHSKMTTSGNVSEHYTGHGADVPARGKALTDQATDALLVVAKGKKVQWLRNDGRVVESRITAANARKLVEAGGIFNVPHGKAGRVQLIANTHQGGDHTNHWHIGLREG